MASILSTIQLSSRRSRRSPRMAAQGQGKGEAAAGGLRTPLLSRRSRDPYLRTKPRNDHGARAMERRGKEERTVPERSTWEMEESPPLACLASSPWDRDEPRRDAVQPIHAVSRRLPPTPPPTLALGQVMSLASVSFPGVGVEVCFRTVGGRNSSRFLLSLVQPNNLL
jgi:hypothetical protein